MGRYKGDVVIYRGSNSGDVLSWVCERTEFGYRKLYEITRIKEED